MALHKGEKKLKGIYLVPDPLMMKPHFGPSEHIKVGVNELKKYFDIEIVVLGTFQEEGETHTRVRSFTKGFATKNPLVGTFRDLKLLYKSNCNLRKLKNDIKNRNIDFIYERGQYLDLRGVTVARQLGINHFYEVNWLNFMGIQQFYSSYFNRMAKRIEEWAYKMSTLNFFVGTQHTLINIPSQKVYTIQNGIHKQIIDRNIDHRNEIKDKIKICYVANLMPHHRFDVFIKALKLANVEERLQLHMAGYNFEEFKGELPEKLECFFYGPMKKDELPELMRQCNVGLISGGPSYSSFMKLFEYAAYKMCVVCPDLENIRYMFDEDEILYFRTDDAESLASQLINICNGNVEISAFGENMYKKVRDFYTWEKIYYDINTQMKMSIEI